MLSSFCSDYLVEKTRYYYTQDDELQVRTIFINLNATIKLYGEYYTEYTDNEEYFGLNYVIVHFYVAYSEIKVTSPLCDLTYFCNIPKHLKTFANEAQHIFHGYISDVISKLAYRIYSFPTKMWFPQ